MTKSKNNDLWTDILPVASESSSPKILMKEQAMYLKQKTKGLLIAEVVTNAFVDTSIPHTQESKTSKFFQIFYLVAPKLRYRYELFSVSHSVMDYPAEFSYDDDAKLVAHNEEEFLSILKQILGSEKTRRILGSLLVQAKA